MKFLDKPKRPFSPAELETKKRCADRLAERYRKSDEIAAEATQEALAMIQDGIHPGPLPPVAGEGLDGPSWMVAAVRAAEEEAESARLSKPPHSKISRLVVRLVGTDRTFEVPLHLTVHAMAGTPDEEAFPTAVDLPPDWSGGRAVKLHFTQDVAGSWHVHRTGTSRDIVLSFASESEFELCPSITVSATRRKLPTFDRNALAYIEVALRKASE